MALCRVFPSISSSKAVAKSGRRPRNTSTLQSWLPAVEYWAAGGQVKKVIGYDAGPRDQQRLTYACNGEVEDEHYEYWYPLAEWGWDRLRCTREIQAEGLPVPPKSSCYYCAAMQPKELEALEPAYLRGIVRLEARARPRFKSASMKGLWGRDTKKRPGSMTEYIRSRCLLPGAEIEHIIADTPKKIIGYQEAYQRGDSVEPFGEFIENQLIHITKDHP
jgi:hypothetical protein